MSWSEGETTRVERREGNDFQSEKKAEILRSGCCF